MNSSRREFLEIGAKFCAAAVVWPSDATAADVHVPFEGEKTTWHEGFDRYDFIMDDATGAITPMTAPASEVTSFGIDVNLKDGKRRCVVVVPQKAAPGNPWSWRGCYWDHQPQTEVELLRRGFHIAFVAPDPGRQGTAWDVWYKFMTDNHGLAKKAAFIGMSKGGVNAFNWGVVNPDKVACIYADNPAVFDEDFAKIPELAKHDIPLLHVVGTEDYVLRHTMTVEKIYHQWGGSITVIMKEGVAHHPHSLIDPTPIADWIEQHMHPVEANRPLVRRLNLHQDALLQPGKFLPLPEEGGYVRDGSRTGIRSFLRSLYRSGDGYLPRGLHVDRSAAEAGSGQAVGVPSELSRARLSGDYDATGPGLLHRFAANLGVGGRAKGVGRGL